MPKACCVLLLCAGLAVTAGAYQQPAPPDLEPANTPILNSADQKPEAAPVKDSHHNDWHVGLGTVTVGGAYFNAPRYPYPLYFDPASYPAAFWQLFWYPSYGAYYPPYGTLGYSRDKGEVKLTGMPKAGKVYVDGAYAGESKDLKHLWLDPGAYDLSVLSAGHETFRQRIYVLTGKTLKIATDQPPAAAD
jgi:hypothetical protein